MPHWILVDDSGKVCRRVVGHKPPDIEGKTWHQYKGVKRNIPFCYDDVCYDAPQYKPLNIGVSNETDK